MNKHLSIAIVVLIVGLSAVNAQESDYPLIYVCHKNSPHCVLFKPFNETIPQDKLQQQTEQAASSPSIQIRPL